MLFERPAGGRRAVLLHVRFTQASAADQLAELGELASSAELVVCATLVARRDVPHARWFIGKGKLAELADLLRETEADVLVVNHDLSPAQQRNLESHLNIGVLTRTELILTIFADRARTHEGQLQVELAQCQHAQTRLVRGWSHLDRQKGGVGLRGAGETQLELDQRMLDDRIKSIKKKLQQVRKRRDQGRRQRQRAHVATIALVGYTNAGKSTLFNALTSGGAVAEDRLFATLDPTMRQFELPGVGGVVLADTVGFIRDLPTALVEAFKATLEEVLGADLLLQVIDVTDPAAYERETQVNEVLAELGAEHIPKLLVHNKIDGLAEPQRTNAQSSAAGLVDHPAGGRIPVSAQTGAGLEQLRTAVAAALGQKLAPIELVLTPSQGRIRAWLYELQAVEQEDVSAEGGWCMQVLLNDAGQRKLSAEGVRFLPGANGPVEPSTGAG